MILQYTEEWFQARGGRCTASKFAAVLSKPKDKTAKESAGRRNYRVQLVTERLTGIPVEGYKNSAMEWGSEQEPTARDAYEALSGALVQQVGYLPHPEIAWCGGSPDGLVGDDGLIEIKCPFVSTVHVEAFLADQLPSEHRAQIQGYLWITGRRWADFVSFDVRMPENLRLFVKRIARDDDYIAGLEAEVRRFLAEVEELAEQLMRRSAL